MRPPLYTRTYTLFPYTTLLRSSIASITMSRSNSFSPATASAITNRSALLAEIAVAMFRLSFHLNSIGAVRGKRSSRCNKVVSQQKLCMVYGGKRQCHRAQFRHIGQQHIAVVQAAKQIGRAHV